MPACHSRRFTQIPVTWTVPHLRWPNAGFSQHSLWFNPGWLQTTDRGGHSDIGACSFSVPPCDSPAQEQHSHILYLFSRSWVLSWEPFMATMVIWPTGNSVATAESVYVTQQQLQLQQKALYKCQTIPFSVHLFGLQSELIHCKKCLKKKKRKTRKGKGGGKEQKENSYRTLILSDNYHLSLLLLLHHVCGWSDEWATWTWFKCWQEEVANTYQIK